MTEIDLADTAIGKFTNEIRAYLAGFKHVEILILTGCELTSLENMPDWSLSAIDVSNNKYL